MRSRDMAAASRRRGGGRHYAERPVEAWAGVQSVFGLCRVKHAGQFTNKHFAMHVDQGIYLCNVRHLIGTNDNIACGGEQTRIMVGFLFPSLTRVRIACPEVGAFRSGLLIHRSQMWVVRVPRGHDRLVRFEVIERGRVALVIRVTS